MDDYEALPPLVFHGLLLFMVRMYLPVVAKSMPVGHVPMYSPQRMLLYSDHTGRKVFGTKEQLAHLGFPTSTPRIGACKQSRDKIM